MSARLVDGVTWHKRLGAVANAFRYKVDYVLIDPERPGRLPALFSRNRWNVMALHDRDHGGRRGEGQGARWMRGILEAEAAPGAEDWQILLLAQPRLLGTRFTPVSFWLALDRSGALRAAVAEVNNTFGDRHAYLCARDDFAPILPQDVLTARKVFHVSPFQPVAGQYSFRFSLTDAAVSVRIDYTHAGGGLLAGISGRLVPLGNRGILKVLGQRPLGALRVIGLIHWQALRLWWHKAPFHRRPDPPAAEISR
jgi:DUF1365 family protein